MNDKKFREYLIEFFRANKDNPEMLAQRLIEMKAFTPEFQFSLFESKKIRSILNQRKNTTNMYFKNLSNYQNYYSTISSTADFYEDMESDAHQYSKEEQAAHFSSLIDDAVDKEEFEKAARIRDYMLNKGLTYFSRG